MNEINVELERATHDTDIDALRERRARLSSKLAVIRVGGATAVEGKEKLRRTEGSLLAARAAMSEGIVPGGGTALLRAEAALDGVPTDGDRGAGVDVVRASLSDPLFWIASNAGYDGQAVVDPVRDAGRPRSERPDRHVRRPVRVRGGGCRARHASEPAARSVGGRAHADNRGARRRGAHRPTRRDHGAGIRDLAEGMARPSSPV